MCSLNSASFRSDRPSAERRVEVDAALQLVRARPAPRALLLVGPDRPGAGDAPDRPVPGVVQRVEGDLVDRNIGPDSLFVPVGERVQLPDVVPLGPLDLRRARTARRLVPTDARYPRVVRLKRAHERLDLADVAEAVGIALPEVRPLLAVLLGDRDHLRPDQVDAVALDEPVAR